MQTISKTYEYKKLRGRIIETYGTIGAFAEALDTSLVTVSKKLNCASGFSQKDIETWALALGIPVEEYGAFFYV